VSEPVVLDSSALLALVNDEPGADGVASILPRAVIGSVNLAEVVGKLSETGFSRAEIDEIVAEVAPDVRPFTLEQAIAAGELRRSTRAIGLSLGDRACIALGVELKALVMTCDRVWAKIDQQAIEGARIEVVR
jgi:PIN domain nuclease of toxin-antitoxin system